MLFLMRIVKDFVNPGPKLSQMAVFDLGNGYKCAPKREVKIVRLLNMTVFS